MRHHSIPTILGIATITVGLVAGVLLVEQNQFVTSQANQISQPQNVRVSNVTDTEFTVSWSTTEKTISGVRWGENRNVIRNINTESELAYTHSITIENLTPSTTYYFVNTSGGSTFDADGIPWQVKTGPTLPDANTIYTISGKVVDPSGKAVKNALVYAVVGGASPLSTTTSVEGNWILSVGNVRTQDLLNHLKINPTTTLVELNVLAPQTPATSAKFYLSTATYGHTIVLGQTNNFTSEQSPTYIPIPTAGIAIPETDNSTTGFGELIGN